jgi:hypothetical protein
MKTIKIPRIASFWAKILSREFELLSRIATYLTVADFVKKYLAFYGTAKLSTKFTGQGHWTLS